MERNHPHEVNPDETPHFTQLADELMSARPGQRLGAITRITDVYKQAPAALLKNFTSEGDKAPLDEVIQMSDPQEFVDLRPETTE